ncbi:uncharacterized protein LOC135608935 isoform X2 [Musa acuminata AAA Group]|uniref:uncharacterized protein LOC135608935 isoform X2 n=1 Tax=Musa acuminata AAA Group TaxID=214697 RepID=UPI0031D34459
MDKTVFMIFTILTGIMISESCCRPTFATRYFCYPLRLSDGTSACESQPLRLKDTSGLTNAAADDRCGGYIGQTPSALQYFCYHKLRGISCCLSTEVGEVQSPQLMVTSGIANTNINCPYSCFVDASTMGKSSRRLLKEDDSYQCADCVGGSLHEASPAEVPDKSPVDPPKPPHAPGPGAP